MWPPKIILHPTDFSKCSDHAFRLACEMASLSHAKVIVLHAHYLPLVTDGNVPPMVLEVEDEEEATRQLNMILPEQPDVPVEHRMVTGTAVQVILEVAKQVGADLIVMGTYGRTGVKRFLVGSVADHVLRRAVCPVLTARPPEEKKSISTKVGKRRKVTAVDEVS